MAFEPKIVPIIRHYKEPQKATTLAGVEVTRELQLFVLADKYDRFFVATQYDDHFLYDNPTPLQPSFMCTCGAPAVLIPPNAPESTFVCIHHHQYGVHATGGTTWQ